MPATQLLRSVPPCLGSSVRAAMAGFILLAAVPAAAQTAGEIIVARDVPNQSVAGPRLPGDATAVATSREWLINRLTSLSLTPLSTTAAGEVSAPLGAAEGQMEATLRSAARSDPSLTFRHATSAWAPGTDSMGSAFGQALGSTAIGLDALRRGLGSGR